MTYKFLYRCFLPISALLVLASLVALVYPGPKLSIEFTGGTQMELELPAGKTSTDLQKALTEIALPNNKHIESVSISVAKTGTVFARVPTLSNEEHEVVLAGLQKSLGNTRELQYTTIGPTVGSNLKTHAIEALLLASLAIIIYLAFAFRKMPGSVSPWSFGTAAVLALLHDILITVGIFTILSHTTTFQVDTLFVTALLSIMGHSVSDTIVIFDRARANLIEAGNRGDFEGAILRSLKQSVIRTLNMGIAVLIMLFSLFFLGSESIRWFILTIITGTIIGSYSSYFVATPLILIWRQWRLKKRS